MSILKLAPFCREAIWGGKRLMTEYGIPYGGANLAEAWVLSCHPDGPSTIENGTYAGKTLAEYLGKEGPSVLGSFGMIFEEFPVLVKLIDAAEALSIQVHPSNYYAMQHEKQYGKTEMWYILDAAPGAYLYYGFTEEISKEELARRIEAGSLTEVLNKVPVKKGDCFFIPSGTLHAIGAGIVIAEIQQNSNVTYRVYDYDRRDAAGNPRPLHIKQAEEVMRLSPPETNYNFGGHLARCEYFTVDLLAAQPEKPLADTCDEESFTSLLVLEGEGVLQNGAQTMPIQKGESLFLPAASGAYTVTGNCRLLRTRVGTI